ncbi:MAG: Flp family type IVb pilin [Gaiellaceae bacterium]
MTERISQHVFTRLFLRIRAEEGQGLVEYALILGLVALVTVGTLGLLGTAVNNALNAVLGGF